MSPLAGPSKQPTSSNQASHHVPSQQNNAGNEGEEAVELTELHKDAHDGSLDEEDLHNSSLVSEEEEGGNHPASQGWRRFNDLTTIDWIQDARAERKRRQQHSTAGLSGPPGSRSAIYTWIYILAHAAQSWFVIALVGAAIGVNAALISIVTAWLSDIKQGHCAAGWWLNRKLCCMEMEADGIVGGGTSEAGCDDWLAWSTWTLPSWIVYVLFALAFSASAAYLVRLLAPMAAGSGISEIKCMLSGFNLAGYLSASVLGVKSMTLPLAIASGLSVGKEGPSVHMACCIGNVVASFFERFARNKGRLREIVTASSAAGVAVAFGSPIGGVLFALEEMTITFPIKTMWRSFFCALVATVTLAAMNPFRTGKLVLFQVSYDRDWHFFEVGFFILLGIFGGLYGAFVIKYNFQVQSFRRNHLASRGVSEAIIIAGLTAMIGYFNKFLRIDMTESLDILFRECEGGGDYDDLCQSWAQWRMVNSLLLATVLRVGLVIVSYGCKVPAGIFVPSMAVGATFGRMVGILVKAAYMAYPGAAIFSACDPEKPCITPGTYAFLGAAAALAGITRITVTVVVIMFELTGALTYILPTMIVVMVTKAVSEFFDQGGIADQAIRFNGLPSLDKEDVAFNKPVASIMKKDIVVFTARDMTLMEIEGRLEGSTFKDFPVVESMQNPVLLGSVSRSDLLQALGALKGTGQESVCHFSKKATDQEAPLAPAVDLSGWMNESPLAVSPRQPIEIVHQLFKTMGPRCVLIEEHGNLVGILTLKDLLRQVIIEEHDEEEAEQRHSSINELEDALEEIRLWLRKVFRRSSAADTSNPIRLSMSMPTIIFSADGDEDTEHPRASQQQHR